MSDDRHFVTGPGLPDGWPEAGAEWVSWPEGTTVDQVLADMSRADWLVVDDRGMSEET